MQKGDILYFARIVPNILYEVCKLKVRTISDTWFSAFDEQTKQSFIFKHEDLENIIYEERSKALKKVREKEKLSKEKV